MNSYEFSLIFLLPDNLSGSTQLLDDLYTAGCDDARAETGQLARLTLKFKRQAETAFIAFKSAIENVNTAIPGARLLEANPDLLGLDEIAEHLGCPRQVIRENMMASLDFPKPACNGTKTLWHLWELAICEKIAVPRPVAEVSIIAFRINTNFKKRHYKRLERKKFRGLSVVV